MLLAARTGAAEVPVEVVDRAGARLVVDGLLRDWGVELTALNAASDVRRGAPSWRGAADGSLRFALARDDEFLWVAAELTDDRLLRSAARRAGDDAVVLTFAVESGGATVVREIALYPGEPGRLASAARWSSGGRGEVAGATVVEAPAPGGVSLEARIPWRAMPEIAANLSTLRARVALRDGDGEAGGETELATGGGSARAPTEIPLSVNARSAGRLAPPTDPVAAFRAERGLGAAPAVLDRRADLAGDAQPERVVVLPGYVLAMGPGVNGGVGYLFVELASPRAQDLVDVALRDVTGEGKADIVLRQRVAVGAVTRELVTVYAVDAVGALQRVFAQEVARAEGAARMSDALSWSPGGRVRVAFERNEGWTRERWSVGNEAGVGAALAPWSEDRARVYAWSPTTRSFALERSEPNAAAPAAASVAPVAPAPAEPAADISGVVALFLQREGLPADARPSHRATGDLVEDPTPEQVLVFDRTVVVVGPRFLGGRSYYAMTLPMNPGDAVLTLNVADITGDGRGEAVVRVRRNVTTQVRGAQIPSQREMLFAYSVDPARRGRVFAAEVARRVEGDSVVNEVRLPRAGGTDVVIEAGVAQGWTEENYPFHDGAQSQFFPLLLPWDASARRVTYRWNGTGFSRAP
jgi:hypothetical protein